MANVCQQLEVGDHGQAVGANSGAQGDVGDDQGLAGVESYRREDGRPGEDQEEGKSDRANIHAVRYLACASDECNPAAGNREPARLSYGVEIRAEVRRCRPGNDR